MVQQLFEQKSRELKETKMAFQESGLILRILLVLMIAEGKLS